uniref:Mediator of RNA polymerase II transcription subunit 14 n=1 Tax=Ditylenchus dipsaci TaxID=166011 RepID=A0A915E4X5_9BILA
MMPSHLQQQPSSQPDFSSQLQRRPADFAADQELENASSVVSASVNSYRKPTVLLPTVPEKSHSARDHYPQRVAAKKKETERKISVVQFAHSTRLIFVKLLAIVKWIKQSKKFEPLTAIRFFLDQQAMHFVDTADRLVAIARDELRFARLPVFQVAQAVDVLTLGTYPRLPQDIKDRFILKPSLSKEEQTLTLRRLNHVLEYQLSMSSLTISPRIDSILIRNGMVIMQVSGEFEINLTMLGEEPSAKWCLLNIKILVENYDVGYGQKLVHPLQVNFLHQIVQEKLQNGAEPLMDAYLVLHLFCRSLQLDVLYCQVLQLSTVSQNYLRVEEYDHVKSVLVISYWLTKHPKKRLSSNYRITIFGSREDQHCGLRTRHHPSSPHLPILEDSDNLSLSRLISETILFRCRERLLRIQRLLSMLEPSSIVQRSGHSMMTLTYPLIVFGEQHSDESLHIAINTFSGTVVCNIPALNSNDEIITELENQFSAAESSMETISKLVNRVRVLVMIERFNKAICGLQVRPVSEIQAVPLLAKLKLLPPDRRLLQFNREEKFFLVVTFLPDSQFGVVLEFTCSLRKLASAT